MNNKMVSGWLFVSLSLLAVLTACIQVSPSPTIPIYVTPSSTSLTNIQPNALPSSTLDLSAQATANFIQASISEEIETGEIQGNKIVIAIEKYYQETGHYPNDLKELIPIYLNQIPLTITGEQFRYKLINSKLYYLWFLLSRAGRKFSCSYAPDLKTWECSGTEQ